MHTYLKLFAAVGIAAGLVVSVSAMSPAPAHPTAKIKVEIAQGGLIIGGTTGEGYVRYHRRNYPVTISGLRFGAIIGGTNATLTGRVSNLNSLRDVEGTYTSIGASASIGTGKNYQQFKNDRGVHLELYGEQDGLELSLDVGGMTVRLGN